MDSLWGPIVPPRWQSNLETSLLNKEEGRKAAASFNEAWNSSFGREQAGRIQSQHTAQEAGDQAERDRRIAALQAERDARLNQMKLDTEAKERKRITGEYQINQGLQNQSIEDRNQQNFHNDLQQIQQEFHRKISPFILSLQQKPVTTSPYGSQGGPNNLGPWRTQPLDSVLNPNPSPSSAPSAWSSGESDLFGGTAGFSFGGQSSAITGESGPFDPTYEDYQRAKSEHPALWLDPVTAPVMHQMDQSWNEMEKVRMEAEQRKDQHREFETKQEAANIAMDVGSQGVQRYGFREDAYHKLPSDIQLQVDSLPNGGRMPQDDPTSKRLRFAPLTSAAEQIMNNWLSDSGQLRIDGANKDAIDQARIQKIIQAAPGAAIKYQVTPKGPAVTVTPPNSGKAQDALGQIYSDMDRMKAAGSLTPQREAEFKDRISKINSLTGSKRDMFLDLIQAQKDLEAKGDSVFADKVMKRIDKLSGDDDQANYAKILNDIDRNQVKKIDDYLESHISASGIDPESKALRDKKIAEKTEIMKRIDERNNPKTKAKTPKTPKGWIMSPGGEWMRPDNSGIAPAPDTKTAAAPAPIASATEPATTTATTPVQTKLPQVKTQTDKSKAFSLAEKALKNNANPDAVIGRLKSIGIPEDEISKWLAETGVGVKK